MKICFIGDGSSVHLKRWLNYFVSKNHEVHLITFTDSDVNGVAVHKIGNYDINSDGGNYKYIFSLNKIKKELKDIKPDIVNAHYVTSYGFIASITKICPLVISAWGTDILVTPNKNFLYKFITKKALKNADLITSDSEFMSNEIKKLVNKKNILTVPMGIEKELLNVERKENKDEINILSLRTVNKNSNIDVIIKAFYLLIKEEKMSNIKLIITNDGTEMENIKSLILKLGIEDRVIVKGFVQREELIELLAKAQLNISIPDSDSTSVTLLESMACGSFNIVSNIPANTEWIQDNYNGLVINEINEKTLKSAMKNAILNEELRQKALAINKDIISSKALWENNMKYVEEEYLKLI